MKLSYFPLLFLSLFISLVKGWNTTFLEDHLQVKNTTTG